MRLAKTLLISLLFAVPAFPQLPINVAGFHVIGGTGLAFRAASELAYGSRVNSVGTKPTGTADGDILIAVMDINSSTAVTPPVGWTEYSNSPQAGFGSHYSHIYWKRASSEPASWTWTHLTASTDIAIFAYVNGSVSGDPNDITATFNKQSGTDTNCIGTGVTTAQNKSLVIQYWTSTTTTGVDTPPSGYTERGFPDDTWASEEKIVTPAGGTGNITTTFTNNTSWMTWVIALKSS